MNGIAKFDTTPSEENNLNLRGCYIVPDFPLYAINRLGNLYNRQTYKEIPVHYASDGTAFYGGITDVTGRERNITIARLLLMVFRPAIDMDLLDVNRINGKTYDDTLVNLEWKETPAYKSRKSRQVKTWNNITETEVVYDTIEAAAKAFETDSAEIRYRIKSHIVDKNNLSYSYADVPLS